MQHNDPFASAVEQVLHTLQTVSASQGNVQTAQFNDLATQFVQTWQTFERAPDAEVAHTVGARFAAAGLGLQAVTESSRVLRVLFGQTAIGEDAADTLWQYLSDVLTGYVTHTKRAAQEATIAEMQATQQREDQLRAVIQELSTPIIPIYRGVLVLPLVGAIDSMRSQEITERLLEEIVRQQADIVIIDITGVSVVDTSVANHLIMTAQAVNLLGSKVIFTGISSTIAQTIIQLGVTLGDVVTLSNLQAGMSYALEQLGLGITELALA